MFGEWLCTENQRFVDLFDGRSLETTVAKDEEVEVETCEVKTRFQEWASKGMPVNLVVVGNDQLAVHGGEAAPRPPRTGKVALLVDVVQVANQLVMLLTALSPADVAPVAVGDVVVDEGQVAGQVIANKTTR